MNRSQERWVWGLIIMAIFVIMDQFKITIDVGLGYSILIGIGAILIGALLLYLIGGKGWFKDLHDPRDLFK